MEERAEGMLGGCAILRDLVKLCVLKCTCCIAGVGNSRPFAQQVQQQCCSSRPEERKRRVTEDILMCDKIQVVTEI